ncbi:MAG: efflux RND transporter permease subunit [Janthinobacterium lividum]
MNPAAPFIRRPVGTTLLAIGLVLAGLLAYARLPVSPLPQVDFPTISVQASLPGASPQTVATSVASPLERHLGQIADVTEMTSSSSVGSARVTLQFGLDRDINGAARDVQAAINAARADLPTALRSNPTYRKVNPADAPVLILGLTSKTLTRGQMYDAATNVLQQRLSQLSGVGQVIIGGAAQPAVRVELNPLTLNHLGIGLEDVRAALASANANAPKGTVEIGGRRMQLDTNDQAGAAADYRPLIVAYRNGRPVRLTDVADVEDSVEDIRNAGLFNGQPAVLVIIFREPGANILDVVSRVNAALPQLKAVMPADLEIQPAADRTPTIRASLHDTEMTLIIAVVLVTLVVFAFLREWRSTLIPAIAVPISIVGTFACMWLLGYSLDNLSLMALTIATGFVVDDAIVVVENVARHIEAGEPRFQAALNGAGEVAFTVLSISLSLIAVFLPILLMGGIVGRLLREFAVTLSMAILVSLLVSLTVTPMMCALFLPQKQQHTPKDTFLARVERGYARSLAWALDHGLLVTMTLVGAVLLNAALLYVIPKGFFPQQDTGRLIGNIQGDQSISFAAMSQKLTQMAAIVQKDPAVQSVVGFTGGGGGGGPGGSTNSASVFVSLKPIAERGVSADAVIGRLRGQLGKISGARLFLQSVQDIRVGGRSSNAQYQFTLQGDDPQTVYEWGPKLQAVLARNPVLQDVNLDQLQGGIETDIVVDRVAAAARGLTSAQVNNALYDAFGQRQVSTIYRAVNQYHVIMEVDPRFSQDPSALDLIRISTAGGTASGTQTTGAPSGTVSVTGQAAATGSNAARNLAQNSIGATGNGGSSSGASVSTAQETEVPLASIARWAPGQTPLAVNHQSQFVSSTISFNLAPGKSLSDAEDATSQAMAELRAPATLHGSFSGTAQAFQSSLASEPVLIGAALLAVYIVLGVLYESLVHPITILSTLPSAGVGAVAALLLTGTEFSIIALIGLVLLIGIVKKNAILMIDFALHAERDQGKAPRDAIYQAGVTRFRPILMTTLAALLGAVPLAVSVGEGGEIRKPLGIAIIGGLLVSQLLTLYTTPVLYLYLDRFRLWSRSHWRRAFPDTVAEPGE